MRWQGKKGSSNVEDRRGGGGGRRRVGGKQMSIGGIILVVIVGLIFGKPPMELLQSLQGGGNGAQQEYVSSEVNDELGKFVSVTLQYTEEVWEKVFPQAFNKNYQKPVLVLFSGKTSSRCGYASAATGPFYCPGDQKVYIDLSFYQELKTRFKAPGDFAMAYVIAHEVGHHIQFLLGITGQVDSQRGKISKAAYNDLSVRLELQADFLAGVWAHHAQKSMNILEQGDIGEAINAAQAIGDDRLQMQAQGYVVPESFTHGTSEQRMRWFKKGFETGDLSLMNTFEVRDL